MCDYAENIAAADKPWGPGTVIRHRSGVRYTVLADGTLFSHKSNMRLPTEKAEFYWRRFRDNFTVLA